MGGDLRPVFDKSHEQNKSRSTLYAFDIAV